MSGERSEKATPQRMKDVRRKGQLGRSQDLSAWVGLGAAAVMLPGVLTRAQDAGLEQMAQVRAVAVTADPLQAVEVLRAALTSLGTTLAPMFVVLVVVTIVVAAAQGGITFRSMKPRFDHLKPAAAAKRFVGPQALWQGVKTLLKTLAVAGVLVMGVQAMVPTLMASGTLPLSAILGAAGTGAADLLRGGIAAGIALAAVDLAVVVRRNRKSTRMTKQELKEENKRTEGDPHVKGAIRAKQARMSRNRMMAQVAQADVVLVNPTHVAVALRYEPGTGAPRVVAKGAGNVATRIRELATEHRVPLVEDVPLARALHGACEVDQEIPEQLFTAVARVLAFVMALRRRGAGAGHHRLPTGSALPAGTPVPPRGRRRAGPAPRS
ncbi:EscU/YscU/HrcU family type III secretion system export apparatus switch protein [Cellulomonas sp. zg-ZUI199]|uniref:EscU/YscU/HrcU family type III secretion system export apparatus switch protein n=1 Tax=Cellulomonas wangleii TaxID=2816956 RepID=A0ABX8D876_9CELL|nr:MULTISPECIES: EscU/YscU/HrcU family type III secretion system export apparatus switch protein [Cellulomonas]MBO0901258.1 EscU/YscU/HrcU family type III secretion system export apparatus switch protein [Cellulomonas sp. zg-ZUI22]MBO0924874.1 EscU/YscU/HrcU family type III secretion system export apparatus switch protein [Cellulomonas wangleii]QVI63040.1 EscU/YscU/HrcU family type III secretion system export apparatus switch protein [Cellulomonas wangleii]